MLKFRQKVYLTYPSSKGFIIISSKLARLVDVSIQICDAWTLILNYIEKFSNKDSPYSTLSTSKLTELPKVDVFTPIFQNIFSLIHFMKV